MSEPECVFCSRIERGEYQQTSVTTIVMFEPLNPVTPGHMLFVPRGHFPDARSGWTFGNAALAAGQYAATRPEHANIITSIGEHATQSVYHLHVHYVPRREGDGLALPWTGQKRT